MNQRGAVIFIAVIMLLILSIIGIYAVGSSTIEVKVSAQKRFYDEAFNVADAGIAFALTAVTFGNIDTQNPSDSTSEGTIDTSDTGLPISSLGVYYLGNTPPPSGSGTGSRGFKAHYHRIASEGSDAGDNATAAIEVEGYRIGF